MNIYHILGGHGLALSTSESSTFYGGAQNLEDL